MNRVPCCYFTGKTMLIKGVHHMFFSALLHYTWSPGILHLSVESTQSPAQSSLILERKFFSYHSFNMFLKVCSNLRFIPSLNEIGKFLGTNAVTAFPSHLCQFNYSKDCVHNGIMLSTYMDNPRLNRSRSSSVQDSPWACGKRLTVSRNLFSSSEGIPLLELEHNYLEADLWIHCLVWKKKVARGNTDYNISKQKLGDLLQPSIRFDHASSRCLPTCFACGWTSHSSTNHTNRWNAWVENSYAALIPALWSDVAQRMRLRHRTAWFVAPSSKCDV